jgi:hypothetical protein
MINHLRYSYISRFEISSPENVFDFAAMIELFTGGVITTLPCTRNYSFKGVLAAAIVFVQSVQGSKSLVRIV